MSTTTTDADQQKRRRERAAKLLAEPLAEPWKSLLDEKSGHVYYWNTVTNEVSWKKPESANKVVATPTPTTTAAAATTATATATATNVPATTTASTNGATTSAAALTTNSSPAQVATHASVSSTSHSNVNTTVTSTATSASSNTTAAATVTTSSPDTPIVRSVQQKYVPGSISLKSFDVKVTVGTGSFGKVKLGQDKASGNWIALKILNKTEIIRLKQVHHIKNEKLLLERVSHPFVVNLLGSFQDPYNLYLVLEYVPGGELFALLRRRKRFNNDVSVFYAAQIVLAFQALHKLNISYRDLKPENVLINTDGYLKITDFGFAKEVPDDSRTYTICGTPEYLAPEIIQSRGHSTAVDWWALGILIYEMLCGYPPFESDSAYGIYKKILAGQISYPNHVNEAAKDLLTRLLHPKPAYRLGNLKNGAEDIKSHPWFAAIDWKALEEKQLRSPYVPKVKSESDTSNFPKYADEEDVQGEVIAADMFAEFGSF